MFYFYVLYSKKDEAYYYGSTNDLRRRFHQHINGLVASTKHRLPVELVYYEAYVTIEQARYREKQIKKSGSVRTSLLKRINMHP